MNTTEKQNLLTEASKHIAEQNYCEEYEISDNRVANNIETNVLNHYDVDEMTFEDLASECLYLASYLKTILASNQLLDNEQEFDKESLVNLECAVSELEFASKEIFYSDEYFRQYKFETFKEQFDNKIKSES